MEEKKVMDILRYYRHDLMNDLQVVHAYTSMGKLDKVEEKLATYMAHYEEERRLMNLNAPNFALWLIPFNSIHPNFRFTYAIRDEIDISEIDEELTAYSQQCVSHMQKFSKDSELYEGKFLFQYHPKVKQLKVQLTLAGSFNEIVNDDFPIESKNITHNRSENLFTYTITIPRIRKGEE
ncbi:Spo0B domain-containing protein [Virgibacillus sp. DJP39]|uniref:Spo0B domain-containing protein n=1 Tax=Virgibacillus sp. DJP39 TaxID=3409790 RepID=UPI003BB756FA